MTERRSTFRRAAETQIAKAIALATARHLSAKGLRALLRARYAVLVAFFGAGAPKSPRGVWYAALKSVAGVGVLDLPEPCQVALLRAEKTRPRRARKEKHAAR